jgi:PAS domain-containing protein
MPDPTIPAIEPERLAELRSRAASRLAGPAAAKGSAARATDALSVLHALASSPETAADALTLLHELQVYQVEIDLQAQELQESRAELESALRRQIELYDHQPAGCFTVDGRSVLLELNRTGAAMLGIPRDDAFGLPLDTFFSADSALRYRAALSTLDADGATGPIRLTLCSRSGPEQPVLARIACDARTTQYLVSLMNAA